MRLQMFQLNIVQIAVVETNRFTNTSTRTAGTIHNLAHLHHSF